MLSIKDSWPEHTYYVDVFKDGEWGTFLIRERQLGENKYSAVVVAYTSFGVYGHEWTNLGRPFKEFIQGLEYDYLMKKMAKKEYCEITARKSIFDILGEDVEDAAELEELIEEVGYIFDDNIGEHQVEVCFEHDNIGSYLMYNEVNTKDYPEDAKNFYNIIWKEFCSLVKEGE